MTRILVVLLIVRIVLGCRRQTNIEQMVFNPDKCEVMHFGRSNKDKIYGRFPGSIQS